MYKKISKESYDILYYYESVFFIEKSDDKIKMYLKCIEDLYSLLRKLFPNQVLQNSSKDRAIIRYYDKFYERGDLEISIINDDYFIVSHTYSHSKFKFYLCD